jgi:hypothetical protein
MFLAEAAVTLLHRTKFGTCIYVLRFVGKLCSHHAYRGGLFTTWQLGMG